MRPNCHDCRVLPYPSNALANATLAREFHKNSQCQYNSLVILGGTVHKHSRRGKMRSDRVDRSKKK
jgi:hypothetical protein